MEPVSLYVHIPFCQRRCGYCDFNTYAGLSHLIDDYVIALCTEIAAFSAQIPGRMIWSVKTVYFGGGTPSLLTPQQATSVLDQIRSGFGLLPDAEITLEANPGTVSAEQLESLRGAGVNRLSLGVQSANEEELRLLDRQHGYMDARLAVDIARKAGFDNISLDLIYGLPNQKVDSWENTLQLALGLAPEHLSLYSLTVEPGTLLERRVMSGEIPLPDPDMAADMYEAADEILDSAGFGQYEISNWARGYPQNESYVSRHNLQYWLNQTYVGFGAGAHGFVGGYRTSDVILPQEYIQRCQGNSTCDFPATLATDNIEKIDSWREMQETMMMGLRLTYMGVSRQRFMDRFGVDYFDVFRGEITELLNKDLVEWDSDQRTTLRLTRQARLVGNQVFQYFV